jgi:hypothetical protein
MYDYEMAGQQRSVLNIGMTFYYARSSDSKTEASGWCIEPVDIPKTGTARGKAEPNPYVSVNNHTSI